MGNSGNSATEMLVSATIEFLYDFPPFDHMETDALRFLAEHLKLAYFPKDALIISPDTGVVKTFRIMQRGKVLARQASEVSMMEQSMLTLCLLYTSRCV